MNENRNFGNHSTWKRDWVDMLRRDRNHPSVVCGNYVHTLHPFICGTLHHLMVLVIQITLYLCDENI